MTKILCRLNVLVLVLFLVLISFSVYQILAYPDGFFFCPNFVYIYQNAYLTCLHVDWLCSGLVCLNISLINSLVFYETLINHYRMWYIVIQLSDEWIHKQATKIFQSQANLITIVCQIKQHSSSCKSVYILVFGSQASVCYSSSIMQSCYFPFIF
jgi:hypothetical protein